MKHALRKFWSLSVSLFTHSENNALEASGPIIEDIKELCDYCIELTEKILEKNPRQSNDICASFTFEPGTAPGMCQFCKFISEDPCITELFVVTHFTDEWNTRRRRSSGEPRYGRRCATWIGRNQFAMWASPGNELGIYDDWAILTIIFRQRCMCRLD